MDYLPALALSIDEHSFRGQDMMITITCVWPERRLIAILPDDRLKTLEKFLKELPASVRRRIKAVCIDFKTKIKLSKRISYGFRNRRVYVRKTLLAFLPLAWLISSLHFLT
ncbi:transposase [Desulfothermobacter acidiphilus]|uniref:transposase n=1 Tax=Desulfothermobacter acidiphilus TaxID=1938353 RepID=UPI003F8B0BA3